MRQLSNAAPRLIFLTLHLDYRDRLMQYKSRRPADVSRLCDYRRNGNLPVEISADADSTSPFGNINVNSSSGFSDYAILCPSSDNLSPVMRCSKGQVMTFTSIIQTIGPVLQHTPS